MRTSTLDSQIRRLRRIVFHPNDTVADRAHNLLGAKLARRGRVARPADTPDHTGHTAADRAMLARNGLSVADFM